MYLKHIMQRQLFISISSYLVLVNSKSTLEFRRKVVYSNTQPFLNLLPLSRAIPPSLIFHYASSQARLKSCRALLTLGLSFFRLGQGVIKRGRLSWLTNSALVYESKCGGRGEVAGSQPMKTAVYITWHGDQINGVISILQRYFLLWNFYQREINLWE